MIDSIGSAHRTRLASVRAGDATERTYIDFRGVDYPDLGTGAATYTLAREDNLIDRGNCESATAPAINGTTPAAASNCTWARSADFARSGDYSYKLTKTVAAGTAGIAYISPATTSDMSGFACGEVVECELYAYVPTAGGMATSEARFVFQGYDISAAAWENIGTITGSGALDAWNRLATSLTIPSDDISGIRISIRAFEDAANAEYFYVDDIKISRHSVPGSHYMSGGYTEHLCPLTETGSMRIKFRSKFAFDTASIQYLCGWFADATSYLYIEYDPTLDLFRVWWRDNGTNRRIVSAQYDNGTSYRNINQWIELVIAFDLSTGSTLGSALWLDKTQDDTTWSGAIDAFSTSFNKLQIRAYNGTAGAYDIAYAEYFPNYVVTDAEVQSDFAGVTAERIYFALDGHGTGMTRCDVSRYVSSISTTDSVANMMSGSMGANVASLELFNRLGEFSDDQYATFAPASGVFNGTAAQKYLQRHNRIWVESWYDGDFDYAFVGKVVSGYPRSTLTDGVSTVSVAAEDGIVALATKPIGKAKVYEDLNLVSATEASSLLHLVARLGMPRVRQHLANNSFEAATITDAWAASGGTWSRQAAPFFGTYCGRLVPGAGTQYVGQFVTFLASSLLSVGDTYTFSVWLLSSAAAAGANNNIALQEHDSGGSNGGSSTLYTLAGGEGWVRVDVSHTVTDATSDRLYCAIVADAGDTIDIDGAMLMQGATAPMYWEVSSAALTAAGASATVSADYADSLDYDVFGFDLGIVSIQHPWRRVEADASVWTELKQIANACGPMYFGMSRCGTLTLESILDDAFSEPITERVVGESDVLRGLTAELSIRNANHIVAYGCTYTKSVIEQIMWTSVASEVFTRSADGQSLSEAVANGEAWPTDDYGIFDAVFGSGERKRYVAPETEPVETDLTPRFRGGADATWFQNVLWEIFG